VARGLVLAAATPEAERGWAALMRREARGRLRHLLPPGTVFAMPTTPFPAPRVGLPLPALGPIRDAILCLCAQGGLAGHPQVSIPGAAVGGLPVGLSLLAARGADALLVGTALALEDA
jgi:amidase